MEYTREELLICAIARMLDGCRNIAVGTASPIPGSAALLVQAISNGAAKASILGSNIHNPFNDGGPELFDRAGQGRVDAFFLGGGQIDGEGNINLVSTGHYPEPDTRFPGSFGSGYLYFTVPRVILFREEHSRRVFVKRSILSAHQDGARRTCIGPAALRIDHQPVHFHIRQETSQISSGRITARCNAGRSA